MRRSSRLDLIPPYMFAELERKVRAKRAAGVDVISLGIGDPDTPTFPPIVAEAQRAVDRIAERLSLATILGKLVGQLAHGQRQWVEIGMVIVCEPKIVLLDEPTAGMSDDETSVTARLIREINKDMTIVVVEHDMQFIGQIASMVTVFHQGKILMEDTFDKVIVDPTVRAVYLGRSQGKVRC